MDKYYIVLLKKLKCYSLKHGSLKKKQKRSKFRVSSILFSIVKIPPSSLRLPPISQREIARINTPPCPKDVESGEKDEQSGPGIGNCGNVAEQAISQVKHAYILIINEKVSFQSNNFKRKLQ